MTSLTFLWVVIVGSHHLRLYEKRVPIQNLSSLSRCCEKGASQCWLCFFVEGRELVRGNAHQFFVLFSNLGTGILSCFSLETKSLSAKVRGATLGSVCSFSRFLILYFAFCFCFFSPAPFDMCRVHGGVPCCCKPVGFLLFRFAGVFPAYCFSPILFWWLSVGLRLESVSRHVSFLASLLSIDCFVVLHLLMRQYWMSGLQKPI